MVTNRQTHRDFTRTGPPKTVTTDLEMRENLNPEEEKNIKGVTNGKGKINIQTDKHIEA